MKPSFPFHWNPVSLASVDLPKEMGPLPGTLPRPVGKMHPMPLRFYKPTGRKIRVNKLGRPSVFGLLVLAVSTDKLFFPLPHTKADGLYLCVQERLRSSSGTSVTLQNVLPQSAAARNRSDCKCSQRAHVLITVWLVFLGVGFFLFLFFCTVKFFPLFFLSFETCS